MKLCTVTRTAPHATSSVEEGVILLDADRCCTYISPAAATLLGRHPEKTRGVPLPAVIQHGADSTDDVAEAMQSGGRLLYHAPDGNGRTIPVEIRFHPVDDSAGERYVAVVRNLDAVEQMENDLRDQLCRERLFKECISHHFFNPLCIAQGYLQLVLNRESNGDDEAMLEATRQALARIETVVKNVVYDGKVRE
ncbi:MAG: PAS domain-containing protein [Thermoplasmatota archaeon]